jgi:hypothetical protein
MYNPKTYCSPIQTYYYHFIQWKCYLVSSNNMWTYGVFLSKESVSRGLQVDYGSNLKFSHIHPYITKTMLSPPHQCICARFCVICWNLCIAPNFPTTYNVHKKFHVKVIIYFKIFWTKTINNILLPNFITKNPLLILL